MEIANLSSPLSLDDLLARIEEVWNVEGKQSREAALAIEGKRLITELIAIGDEAAKQLSTQVLTQVEVARLQAITFEWPEGAKRFMLLWRNVLLEWERATVVYTELRTDKEQLARLAADSKASMLEAARSWLDAFAIRASLLTSHSEVQAEMLHTWSLQTSPWSVYRTQLEELLAQMTVLHDDFSVRVTSAKTLLALQSELLSARSYIDDQLDELAARAKQGQELLQLDDLKNCPDGTFERLETLDPTGLLNGYVEDITQHANTIIDRLPQQVKLFVRGQAGAMQYRDVELERQTGQWVSAEVIPLLQRADRSLNQSTLDLSRTLKETRSKLRLAVEDEQGIDLPGAVEPIEETEQAEADAAETLGVLQMPLQLFLARLEKSKNAIGQDVESAEQKVRDELRLSRVYDPEASFLEVSFEAGMSQVLLTQDALLNRFGKWLGIQRKTFRKLRNRVAEEEALSQGERIVRVLRTRRADARISSYNSVIVTRGFIGEAFHAGREYELDRANNAITSFREGFRGAILVTGQRFSGRSHFAELLAGRYFEQRTVRLRPNQTIEVAGRTFTPTYDLEAALAFVRKHSVGQQLMLLIDDFELWADAQHKLASNADALIKAIDELSTRVMFVVTAGNWTSYRLNEVLHFGNAFQVEINMDELLMEDFQQTVLVRHAATHYALLNGDGNAMSERAMRDRAENMYRTAKGNVGDGLRRWIQGVKRGGVGEVMVNDKTNYLLPNFIDADNGILLTTLKYRRYANEYELRKAFGPAFDEQYRLVLMRLQRLGLLQRHHSGTLTITPEVNNEIGRLLQREGYLQAAYARTPLHL